MAVSENNNKLAENKVLILYTLNKINKDIAEDNLFKIISSINDINYFYFIIFSKIHSFNKISFNKFILPTGFS